MGEGFFAAFGEARTKSCIEQKKKTHTHKVSQCVNVIVCVFFFFSKMTLLSNHVIFKKKSIALLEVLVYMCVCGFAIECLHKHLNLH